VERLLSICFSICTFPNPHDWYTAQFFFFTVAAGQRTTVHCTTVDPITGCHTNDIESRWNACKAKFKARFGVPRDSLPSYLDAYMWRARRDDSRMFADIVDAIARQYPV